MSRQKSRYLSAVAALTVSHEYTRMVNEFDKRRTYMYARLCRIKGIRCIKPTGAFYIFPDTSAFGISVDVANALLEKVYVAVVPGKDFCDDRCIRMSYAIPMAGIREGLDRMEQFFLQ